MMISKNFVGFGGLAVVLIAGCSAGVEDGANGEDTAQTSDELRRRRPGRGFDYRGPRPHPRHQRGDCGRGGSGGTGGTLGKGGSAPGGSGGRSGGGMGGRPGGSGGSGGTAGACTLVGPMLLDDFEDGDIVAPSTPSGAWFSANDATPDAVQAPNPWVPTAGGADGSAFAACTNGSGFLNWGALIGMVFPGAVENQLSCLDVSRLEGIRFKARGSGLVKLNLPTRATTSTDIGGTCTGDACNFSPNYTLPLTSEWQTIEVPWLAVAPGNLPFDARDLLGVQFQAYDVAFPASAPIDFDFCVDDLEVF